VTRRQLPDRPEQAWLVASTQRRLLLCTLALPSIALAQGTDADGTGLRREEAADATLRRLLGSAEPKEGRVHLALPEIAESGNSVPLTVRVDSPMTESEHVKVVHVVAERNPRPWVASFFLGPRCGRAEVAAYIRLRDSQAVTVLAQMNDDSWWVRRVQVTVIVGACESLAAQY
jgi:sulfur-oxidizing protein SoxY